jgi:hypothetical protein
MNHQVKHEIGWYKPGVRWIKLDDKEYWLQQNPATSSIFAEGKRAGMDILWVCSDKPIPGHIAYTGELMINGKRMLRYDAVQAIRNWLTEKELMIAHA